jgi:hypothetical protein
MFVLGGVAEHSVVLKAENIAEKLEWMGKLRSCMESQKGSSTKKESDNSSTHLGTLDGAVVSPNIFCLMYGRFKLQGLVT